MKDLFQSPLDIIVATEAMELMCENGGTAESMDIFDGEIADSALEALKKNEEIAEEGLDQLLYALMDYFAYEVFEKDMEKKEVARTLVDRLSEEARNALDNDEYMTRYTIKG